MKKANWQLAIYQSVNWLCFSQMDGKQITMAMQKCEYIQGLIISIIILEWPIYVS